MSIETIANIILVAITGTYAFFTYRILQANRQTINEMQKQNEAYLRPYILINVFVPSGSIVFYLRIKNIGKSVAGNVRLDIDRDFYQFGGNKDSDNLKNFFCFLKPIKNMSPDAELVFELAQSFVVFGDKADPLRTPTTFTITAHYDWGKRHYDESTTIDMSPFFGSVSPPDPMHEIIKGIKDELVNICQIIKSAK